MARHPKIIDVIEGSNTITSSIASKLSRSMKMLAETYGKDNCHLYKAASFPDLTPDTILEIINCIWCHRSLDDEPSSLKSILTVINFCGPPAKQSDYKQCVKMETRLDSSHREEQLGQHVECSKPKTMDSFIRRRQNTLEDFTTLLVNLWVVCIFLVRIQLESNHNSIIGWFTQQTASVVTLG